MPLILELQRDKSFRIRLIAICLGVAFVVASIYITVSYRLASELGLNAELDSLHRQTMLLHDDLIKHHNEAEERLTELVNLIYLNDHASIEQLYVEAKGSHLNWSLKHNISFYQIGVLRKRLDLKIPQHENAAMANGIEPLEGKRFLWQVVNEQGYKVLIIEQASSVEEALSLVTKRLSIVSIIIFWLATWLAISLSSWVTKRVQSKNKALARLATHDFLTGLPNRLYLNNILQSIMPENQQSNIDNYNKVLKEEQATGSLFVIDLDKFKEVNDAFGHSAGDTLLKKVAQRLLDSLDEKYNIVRFGGDEFVIWATGVQVEDAILLAKKLIAVCDEPLMIHQLAINTGASIGIAHYPTHANTAESLIICADTAMYDAKQKRTGWSIFNQRDPALDLQRLSLRADLNEAFAQQQIQLYYQPKVALSNGHIIGVEALARWYHPTKGILTPAHFIDLIEQSGRVQEFGRYVIKAAIVQLAQWQTHAIDMPIAVNLSPYNLLDPGLLDFTLALLKEHNIRPNRLEIELIESSTSLNIEQLSPHLSHFKQAGIRLAIDDFGTGMSSLSYLSSLNVDVIKIDKSFIHDIDVDTKKQAIVTTAITLANVLNNQTIAEGIETLSQLETLKQMGCLYGQGYYFAPPMSAEDMLKLLQTSLYLPHLA